MFRNTVVSNMHDFVWHVHATSVYDGRGCQCDCPYHLCSCLSSRIHVWQSGSSTGDTSLIPDSWIDVMFLSIDQRV